MNRSQKFLYLVTDSNLCKFHPLEKVVKESILGGVQIVQYREKHFNSSLHLDLVIRLRRICADHSILFLINDSVELSLLVDADGVHLGQGDLDVEEARTILGNDKIIGLSIETENDLIVVLEKDKKFNKKLNPKITKTNKNHSSESNLQSSLKDSFDLSRLVQYLGVSPIFPTPTKTDTKGSWGLEGIKKVRSMTDIPLVAIGGINIDNAASILESGADSIAIVSAICSSPNPQLVARQLKTILTK